MELNINLGEMYLTTPIFDTLYLTTPDISLSTPGGS